MNWMPYAADGTTFMSNSLSAVLRDSCGSALINVVATDAFRDRSSVFGKRFSGDRWVDSEIREGVCELDFGTVQSELVMPRQPSPVPEFNRRPTN